MQKILITGAGGFIGQYVTKQLLSDGFKVRAFVRDRAKIRSKNVKIALGDMSDRASLAEALKGIDGVIHLAAVKLDERDSCETNVLEAKNLINASRKNRVEFMVNIGSSSAKKEEKGKWALTKKLADEIMVRVQFQL